MNKAFVFIRVKLGSNRENYLKGMIETLTDMDTSVEVHQIYGIYDIIVKLQTEDIEELRKSCFSAVDNFAVQSHMTHIVVGDDDEEENQKNITQAR